MRNDRTSNVTSWVSKFAPLVQPNATVLDLACGGGRHTEFFLARGHRVIALDKDTSGLATYSDNPACEAITFDLESSDLESSDLESSDLATTNQSKIIYSEQLPFFEKNLQCIVVVNYLYRPLMSALIQALSPGGILIYQTFMAGNERYGRPKNPDFLLSPLELPNTFNSECDQIDFFEGFVSAPKRAVIQCYCGRKR
jgi:SAM-dependent methyltransferase